MQRATLHHAKRKRSDSYRPDTREATVFRFDEGLKVASLFPTMRT